MRLTLSPHFVISILSLLLLCSSNAAAAPPGEGAESVNRLTKSQEAAGWKLLFDGKTSRGWRSYYNEKFPEKGWTVEDNTLRVIARGGAGDVMTTEQYADFDLRLEWKVSEKANSGIMYRVTPEQKAPWHTGPEYQIFDDKGHGLDPKNPHSAGALYGLYAPPPEKPSKPAGEWNQTRIVLRGDYVAHWLNGIQLMECVMGSKDWQKRVDASKFKVFPKFGRNRTGHIVLQDHGHDVWFRNIRIRKLEPQPESRAVPLFNGKDLEGLTCFLNDNSKMEAAWSVKDGVLICKGQPFGYIKTVKDYTNFVLKLEWRFDPVTKKAGNSGVLFRQVGPDKVWPKCIEAQLHSGYAGDFWNIGGFTMTTDAERTKGRNTRKTHINEFPGGQWNEYEIIADGGDITLIVNGEVLNRATAAAEIPGKICLQSEGVEIHFRNIRLISLDGKETK